MKILATDTPRIRKVELQQFIKNELNPLIYEVGELKKCQMRLKVQLDSIKDEIIAFGETIKEISLNTLAEFIIKLADKWQ